MKIKLLTFVLLTFYFNVNAQIQDYIISKKDKNILNSEDFSVKPTGLKVKFSSCNNAELQLNYLLQDKVYGIAVPSTSNSDSEIEIWKLNFIRNTENGDYIFQYLSPNYQQKLKEQNNGYYSPGLKKGKDPEPYFIFISKDKQKIYIYNQLKDDYRPFLAAHVDQVQSKNLSAKKDKPLFDKNFALVKEYIANQLTTEKNGKLLIENNLKIDSLKLKDISSIFTHLKNLCLKEKEQNGTSFNKQNKYSVALSEFSKSCLKIKELPDYLKFDLIEISNNQIILIETDKCYEYLNSNISNVNEADLIEFQKLFEKNNQIIRSSFVLLEILKKYSTEKNSLKLVDIFAKMSDGVFNSILDFKKSELEKLSESFRNNDSLIIKYPSMLISHKQYQLALSFLENAAVTPQTKYYKFLCITKLSGTIKGIDYLMGLNPRAKVANSLLSELGKTISSDSIILATKHIYNNYRKSLDSIDITAIANFTFSDIGINYNKIEEKSLSNSDYKWLIKIYKELKHFDEADLIEMNYWVAKKLDADEVYAYVNKKELNPIIASLILTNYGENCIQEAFRPGGDGVDRDEAKNHCVKMLMKAVEYNPKDGYIYKVLGDAWAFIGDGNKSDYYYGKADALGAYMKDRQRPGQGKGPRKKDGTPDMRYNSNR